MGLHCSLLVQHNWRNKNTVPLQIDSLVSHLIPFNCTVSALLKDASAFKRLFHTHYSTFWEQTVCHCHCLRRNIGMQNFTSTTTTAFAFIEITTMPNYVFFKISNYR